MRAYVFLLAGVLSSNCALAAERKDLERLQDEAVTRLQAYVQVDTTNPPGNESRGVQYLAQILAAEGIPYETVESGPGRGNLWARLEGGPLPALVLLHHIDVVPADDRYWTVKPFAAEVRDGYMYGRGTLDTKGLGIMELQAFLALHRSGKPLRRPVIFVATADEEAGGSMGAGWLAEHRPEIFKDAGLLINEGGAGLDFDGRQMISVEVTQKVPLWIRLVSRGRPGHGSVPGAGSAVTRLVGALDRIATHEFEPRIIPAVDRMARARAEAGIGAHATALGNLADAVKDPQFRSRLLAQEPSLAALTRNTCAITRLEGSTKINVIPPEASAEIDCRLLPDQDVDAFIAELKEVLADPSIEVRELMRFKPAESPTDTDLFAAIRQVSGRHFPKAVLVPSVATGFTDSHFFRERGIVSYGYVPVMLAEKDAYRAHGNDERLSIENIRRGTLMLTELVEQVAAGKAR